MSELDKLAKALGIVFYQNKKLNDLVKMQLSKDISKAGWWQNCNYLNNLFKPDTEAALLRYYSLGCVLFTIYCKFNGLLYLWNTLGAIVKELDELIKKTARVQV